MAIDYVSHFLAYIAKPMDDCFDGLISDSMTDALMLIPAAGFGRRVGAPEAKEMLVRPDGRHMIDFSLDLARSLGLNAHVITRAEKPSLIRHLSKRSNVSYQTVPPTREWPESLLLSQPHWRERNLVVLPDSDFSPVSVVRAMLTALSDFDSVWALFDASPKEFSSWGVVEVSLRKHAEKPRELPGGEAKPWGLFGFRREAGESLCKNLLASTVGGGQWFDLPGRSKFLNLKQYQDLTRGLLS